jgi:hypothetical protein
VGTLRLNKTATVWNPEGKQLRSWLLIAKMSVYKKTKVKFKLRLGSDTQLMKEKM